MKTKLALITGVALASLAVMAAPAQAKGLPGEGLPIEGYARITGPGLRGPIFVWGHYSMPPVVRPASGRIPVTEPPDAFARLLIASGINSTDSLSDGYYSVTQNARSLGPKYQIGWFLDPTPDENTSRPILQDVYPFAPQGPVFRSAPGQSMFGRWVPSLWWIAPSPVRDLLISAGIPASAATASTQGGALSGTTAGDRPWLIGGLLAALLGLVVASALAGRRVAVRALPRSA